MKLTNEMLEIAIAKAIEAGLLSRRASKEDLTHARELMRDILQSALNAKVDELSFSRALTHRTMRPPSRSSTA